MNTQHPGHGAVYLYGGFLFAITFLLALISLDSFFWSDDFWLIPYAARENAFQYWFTQRSDFTGYWPYLHIHFAQPDVRYYWYFRPLATLSLKADVLLAGGISPVFMHASQAVWAGFATVAFWLGARRLAPAKVAALAALLFALWPLNAEVHSWIAARSGLLSLLFAMLAVWAAGLRSIPGIWRAALIAVFTSMAMLSKSDAAMVVLWLGAGYIVLRDTRNEKNTPWLWAAVIGAVGCLIVVILAKLVFAPPFAWRIESLHFAGLGHPEFLHLYLSNMVKYLLLLHLFVPPFFESLPIPLSLILLAGAPVVWLVIIKKLDLGRLGTAMLALTLLPLIPLSLVPAEERLLLFSSASYCILLAHTLVALARRWPVIARPGVWVTALLLLTLFSAYHHYTAGTHGRLTQRTAQAFLEGCGPFEPGQRIYVPNAIWPVAFLNKAVQQLNDGKAVDIMQLAVDHMTLDAQPDIPRTFAWFFCQSATYGCRPPSHITIDMQRRPEGLRMVLRGPGFFSSLVEKFVGIGLKLYNATGELYREDGAFSVTASDLNREGYPQTLTVDFAAINPAVCVQQGAVFRRLPIPEP